LRDKTRYVTHYRCLQFYLSHGLVLDKIHRVVAFTQHTYILPFIKFCNDGRKNAKSEFDLLYKLIANTFYGKTVENVRKRANVRQIANPAKFVHSISKASYKCSSIINADLAMVENFCTKVVLSKPIAVGCAILESVKLVMSSSTTIACCCRSATVCISVSPDSFVCHIHSDNLVGELGAIVDQWLDTSNFEHAHPLYSSTNFRALGKFKSETANVPPTEFCGLRSKMYSLLTLTGDREYRKAKVVPKSYLKKHVTHEQYLHILR